MSVIINAQVAKQLIPKSELGRIYEALASSRKLTPDAKQKLTELLEKLQLAHGMSPTEYEEPPDLEMGEQIQEALTKSATPMPMPETLLGLHAGFYVMASKTGAGKTLSAYAMYLQAKAEKEGSAAYLAIGEPRSASPGLTLKALKSPRGFVHTVAHSAASNGIKLVLIDSLTFILPRYERTAADSPAFEGGKRLSDAVAALALNTLAAEQGITIVGIVNSNVYPPAEIMPAASEGTIMINDTGVLKVTDRSTREQRNLVIASKFVDEARRLIYPDAVATKTGSRGAAVGALGSIKI